MAEYTPGPWHVEDQGAAGRLYGWSIECEDGTLADMRVYPGNGDDALMIAASPDLLKACKAVLAYYQHPTMGGKSSMLKTVRDALAKAEGKEA